MESLKELIQYSYPANLNPDALMRNSAKIVQILDGRYPGHDIRVVGTGTSGAIVSTAIVTASRGRYKAVMLRKPSEATHRNTIETVEVSVYTPVISVVVDDLICSGSTLAELAATYSNRSNSSLPEISVAAIPCDDSGYSKLIRTFPNLKLIIQ